MTNHYQKIIAIGLVSIAFVAIAGTTIAVIAENHTEPEVMYRDCANSSATEKDDSCVEQEGSGTYDWNKVPSR